MEEVQTELEKEFESIPEENWIAWLKYEYFLDCGAPWSPTFKDDYAEGQLGDDPPFLSCKTFCTRLNQTYLDVTKDEYEKVKSGYYLNVKPDPDAFRTILAAEREKDGPYSEAAIHKAAEIYANKKLENYKLSIMDTKTLLGPNNLKIEEAKTHIVDWLRNYCKTNNIKGFTLGVSGGIDSALASALCAETGLPLLCVEMPIHQNEEHVGRAQEHIDWLMEKYDKVYTCTLEMTETFDNLNKQLFAGRHQLPWEVADDQEELGLANTRSRLRMIGLYHMATLNGFIVCGTGNKVEDFGVGFFTKYGDGGVDISPIADLMKSEVRAMAASMGVSDNIINAVPSDGLWDDTRSDEDQIGATYDELEWAMTKMASDIDYADDLSITPRQKEVLKIYNQRHNANRHKMDSIPVCSVEKFRE